MQLVNDERGETIASSSVAGKSTANAEKLGTAIAQKAKQHKVTSVVFDRSGYRYHGRVAAIADAVRKGGITI